MEKIPLKHNSITLIIHSIFFLEKERNDLEEREITHYISTNTNEF